MRGYGGRRRRDGAWRLVAAGLFISACVVSDTHWHPTASDTAFVDQVFTVVQSCCARSNFISSVDEQDWKALRLASGFSRDEALRASCLAELRQLATAVECLPEVLNNNDDPCVRVFSEPSGPQPPGASCAVRGDCAGTLHGVTLCARKGSDVCASLAPGVVGSHPCVPPLSPSFDIPLQGFFCASGAGLFCELTTHACAATHAAGETCSSQDACTSGMCLLGGTCAPVVAAGESCSQAACAEGARCDPKTMTCVARLPDGAKCTGADDECIGTCVTTDFTCHPLTSAALLALSNWCD